MRLSLGLEAKQIQTFQLAPKMIQSMEILQLPILALLERVEQEMNENPVLEVNEEDPNLPEETEDAVAPDTPPVEEKELVVDNDHDNADDFERLFNLHREDLVHFYR